MPRNPLVVICGLSLAFRTLSSGSRFHQMKREALQKLNRRANELEKGSDTVRKK